jgi:K+-sensing histidine kinase KdpD
MICIDSLRLEQIIGNIINNSYKYANTTIEVSACLKRAYLQLDIKDYGKGISEEELPLIFNKFYRGKEKEVQQKSGAGLGLYISRFLMEKMDGEISGYNVKDGFIIRLLIPISTGS